MGSITSGDQVVPFGHAMREHFPTDPKYTNLNHGSFGTIPLVVQDQRRKFEDEEDAAPDLFIRYKRSSHIKTAREAVAQVLNAPANEVVFVKNATAGVNTVLRNLVYSPGDVIIYFADVYPACGKTIASLVETTPLRSRRVSYTHPLGHDELVRRFRDEISRAKSEGLNVRVAIFDTIVSQPGVRFPFERAVEVCREEGVLSMIDAAHGVGHVPLDLGKLQPDFFVSNCHKWLFTPRGCAVLYVRARNQDLIRTTYPTSHGFRPAPGAAKLMADPLPEDPALNAFENLFDFVATDNDSAYFCVPAAVEFRRTRCGGEDAITSYCETLAYKAGNRVAEILGTEVLSETGGKGGRDEPQGTSQLRRCAFANVRLPISIVGDDGKSINDSNNNDDERHPAVVKSSDVNPLSRWIERAQASDYNTVVPVFRHGDHLWVRLSAQIYLELSDFEWLGQALKKIVGRVASGEPSVQKLTV